MVQHMCNECRAHSSSEHCVGGVYKAHLIAAVRLKQLPVNKIPDWKVKRQSSGRRLFTSRRKYSSEPEASRFSRSSTVSSTSTHVLNFFLPG